MIVFDEIGISLIIWLISFLLLKFENGCWVNSNHIYSLSEKDFPQLTICVDPIKLAILVFECLKCLFFVFLLIGFSSYISNCTSADVSSLPAGYFSRWVFILKISFSVALLIVSKFSITMDIQLSRQRKCTTLFISLLKVVLVFFFLYFSQIRYNLSNWFVFFRLYFF